MVFKISEGVGNDVKHDGQLIQEVSLAMNEQSAGINEVLGAITSLVESTQSIRVITQELCFLC